MKSAPTTISQGPPSGATAARRSGGFNLIVLWTLYTLTLRQHLHGKRWMVMGVLFLLPAGLAVLLRAIDPNVPRIVLEFLFAFMLIPQALLPLLALLYSSGMIQDEQEEQTITYLLIRPLPRWALYVVKLLATLSTTVVLTALFTGITYAAIYLGSDAPVEATIRRCAEAAGIQSLAVATYCCLFGLLSLLTKRTLIVGILYSVIIEGVLANLPFGVRLLTVIYYARLIAYRTLPFIEESQGRKINIAADAWQFNVQADPNLLEHPTGSTCITVLLATCAVSTVLAAIICSRREFHVKTPEGN
jgi:ABC-2 type transport system permease protein